MTDVLAIARENASGVTLHFSTASELTILHVQLANISAADFIL